MYKLVIADDDGRTTVVPLIRDEITIGRKEGNTIRLTERNVSRNHARLVKRNGSFVIEDLGSYNGLKINGARVDDHTELQAGDRFTIGDYNIAFESQREVLSRPPSPPAFEDGVPPSRLVMVTEPAPGAEFSLTKERLRIGRDEHLDIWVDHVSVSREHAEVQLVGDRVTIFDLDSVNGMKVNGVETGRASLQPGDIIALGDVEFKFVPASSTHSIDASPTPVAPPRAQASAAGKFPLGAVLGLAAGALGLLLFMGWQAFADRQIEVSPVPSPQPVAAAPPATAEPTAAAPVTAPAPVAALSADDELVFATSLEACQRAAEQGRWEDALRYSKRALVLAPDSDQAIACHGSAQTGQAYRSQLEGARSALGANEVDKAWQMASVLPAKSSLRKEASFTKIKNAYATLHLKDGNQALRQGDRSTAAREAATVLQIEGLSKRQERDARRLASRAARRVSSKPSAATSRPATKPTPVTPAATTPSATPAPPEPVAAKPPEPAATPKPAGGIAAARECLKKGDNACAIAALEGGKATTSSGLALLIETYRAMGSGAAAKRHMGTFVRRYPEHARTAKYEQMLRSP